MFLIALLLGASLCFSCSAGFTTSKYAFHYLEKHKPKEYRAFYAYEDEILSVVNSVSTKNKLILGSVHGLGEKVIHHLTLSLITPDDTFDKETSIQRLLLFNL